MEQARLLILDMTVFIAGIFKRLDGLTQNPKPPHAAPSSSSPSTCPNRSFRFGPARPGHRQATTRTRRACRQNPRQPTFKMREPQPRPKYDPETEYLPQHLRPCIALLTDAVLSAAQAPVLTPAPAPRDIVLLFSRRFIALHAAFGNVHAQAARWCRRHAALLLRSQSAYAPALQYLLTAP